MFCRAGVESGGRKVFDRRFFVPGQGVGNENEAGLGTERFIAMGANDLAGLGRSSAGGGKTVHLETAMAGRIGASHDVLGIGHFARLDGMQIPRAGRKREQS